MILQEFRFEFRSEKKQLTLPFRILLSTCFIYWLYIGIIIQYRCTTQDHIWTIFFIEHCHSSTFFIGYATNHKHYNFFCSFNLSLAQIVEIWPLLASDNIWQKAFGNQRLMLGVNIFSPFETFWKRVCERISCEQIKIGCCLCL